MPARRRSSRCPLGLTLATQLLSASTTVRTCAWETGVGAGRAVATAGGVAVDDAGEVVVGVDEGTGVVDAGVEVVGAGLAGEVDGGGVVAGAVCVGGGAVTAGVVTVGVGALVPGTVTVTDEIPGVVAAVLGTPVCAAALGSPPAAPPASVAMLSTTAAGMRRGVVARHARWRAVSEMQRRRHHRTQ